MSPAADAAWGRPRAWTGLQAGLADRLPPVLRGAGVVPSRRAVAALAAVAVTVVVFTGWTVLRSGRPTTVAVAPVPRSMPSATPSSTPAKMVIVDVAGKVRRPGVVRLPLGSRVADALRAAGGPRPGVDIGLLNLARPLTDGEQVVVGLGSGGGSGGPPVPGGDAAGAGASGAGAAGAQVDLNTATLTDLDGLPGVGPVLAQRIVDWRTEHGPFASVDQLREVSGIGDRKFDDLKNRVRV